MGHYLKHLFELYLAYMKLAFIGMALSAILLFAYATFKTNNLLIGLPMVVLSLVVVGGLVLVLRQRKILKAELNENEIDPIEIERLEVERRKMEIERGRPNMTAKPVKGKISHKIEDFQDAVLVHELALLVDDLQKSNVSKHLVLQATEEFLEQQEGIESNKLFILRNKISTFYIEAELENHKTKTKTEKEETDKQLAG